VKKDENLRKDIITNHVMVSPDGEALTYNCKSATNAW
jgi:hypothetical protein